MKLRFGSGCSGIEAASVAFGPLGWEADWLSEVDVAASQVLAHRLGATAPQYPLPGTEKQIAKLRWRDKIDNFGDMSMLPSLVRLGLASAPDLLCGGTPCQAFSLAGRREGLNDPRGGLTMAFVDLADAIDEKRLEHGEEPCIVYWENVPGVLTDAGNAFGCFLAALVGDDAPVEPGPRPEPGRSSAFWTWKKKTGQHVPKWPDAGLATGPLRTVGWRIGDAQYFGLAQRRRRVVLVGSAREGFDPAAILLEFDGVRRDSPPSRETGEGVTHAVAPCLTSSGRGVERTGDPRGQDPVVACERPGVGSSVELAYGGGRRSGPVDVAACLVAAGQKLDFEVETFVLQPVEDAELYSIMPMNSGKDYKARKVDVAQPLMAGGPVGGNQGGDFVVQAVAIRGRDGGATAELGGETAYALRAAEGGGSDPYVLALDPRGTDVIVHGTERVGALDTKFPGPAIAFSCKDYGADATEELAPTMRAMGHDGSHANAGGQIAVCVTGDITHTLTADGHDASEDGTGRGPPIVAQPTMAVRRLMPVECHKLQGFPEDWCAVPIGNRIAADGPQYKQLGNSWAVNHHRWVGQRLNNWLDRQDLADLLA